MAAFDPSRQFTESDFTFHAWGAMVHVHWSKTIQFWEHSIRLPLPRIPGSILCPVAAIRHAFSFTQSGPSSSQAFSWLHHQSLQRRPFTYKNFLYKLHSVLASLGYQETSFAIHSFCQGGGLLLLFRLGSHWNSNAAMLYLTVPMHIRLHSVNLIPKHILSH